MPCRDFITTYSARSRGRLSFPYWHRLGSTDSCTEEIIELERSYRRGLSSDDYAVDSSSGEIALRIRTYRDEIMLFEPLPLAPEGRIFKERWHLTALMEPERRYSEFTGYSRAVDLVPGSELIISFDGSDLTGSAVCHSYEAPLQVEGSRTEIGDLQLSEKPCEDRLDLVEQERRVIEALNSATFFQVYEDQLFIQADNGEALLFRAE